MTDHSLPDQPLRDQPMTDHSLPGQPLPDQPQADGTPLAGPGNG